MIPALRDYFTKLRDMHSIEITFWKNIIIEALPQSNILQSMYHRWVNLPDEVRTSATMAGYIGLTDAAVRSQINLNAEKYIRLAVIFAHVFDCWSNMQETFGACGFSEPEVDWSVGLQEDVLHTMERFEEFILIGEAEFELSKVIGQGTGTGRKRRSPSPIVGDADMDESNSSPIRAKAKKNRRRMTTEFFKMETDLYAKEGDPANWNQYARKSFHPSSPESDRQSSSGSSTDSDHLSTKVGCSNSSSEQSDSDTLSQQSPASPDPCELGESPEECTKYPDYADSESMETDDGLPEIKSGRGDGYLSKYQRQGGYISGEVLFQDVLPSIQEVREHTDTDTEDFVAEFGPIPDNLPGEFGDRSL